MSADEDKKLDSTILQVLKTEAHSHHGIRMGAREILGTRDAPFIETNLKRLRKNGLIYFKGKLWYLADVVPCEHCQGTGFVKNKSLEGAPDAEGQQQGEAESEVEKNQEVAPPASAEDDHEPEHSVQS